MGISKKDAERLKKDAEAVQPSKAKYAITFFFHDGKRATIPITEDDTELREIEPGLWVKPIALSPKGDTDPEIALEQMRLALSTSRSIADLERELRKKAAEVALEGASLIEAEAASRSQPGNKNAGTDPKVAAVIMRHLDKRAIANEYAERPLSNIRIAELALSDAAKELADHQPPVVLPSVKTVAASWLPALLKEKYLDG